MKKGIKKKTKTLISNSPINIIVDSREQLPFQWVKDKYEDISIQVDTLTEGDYTIVSHDRPNDDYSIIVERKESCKELLLNIGRGWKRFVAELSKLQSYHTKCIVVCEPDVFDQLYYGGFTKMHPSFVRSRLMEVYIKYQVPVFFFPNKSQAEEFVYFMFRKTKKISAYED